ncbi:MAG: hypothetical protein GY716_19610, partial [bacterium]|nr:hypothetical protein [bacterium]
MNFTRSLIGTALLLGSASVASAQYVTVEELDGLGIFSISDLSPDGRYMVGGFADGGYLLDRKTGVLTTLPAPGLHAAAVSDDGTVVIGDIPDPEGIGSNVAAMWTADENSWFSLGHLPNAGSCPSRSDS